MVSLNFFVNSSCAHDTASSRRHNSVVVVPVVRASRAKRAFLILSARDTQTHGLTKHKIYLTTSFGSSILRRPESWRLDLCRGKIRADLSRISSSWFGLLRSSKQEPGSQVPNTFGVSLQIHSSPPAVQPQTSRTNLAANRTALRTKCRQATTAANLSKFNHQ